MDVPRKGVLCELCRAEPAHNFHHFIPRTVQTNKWFKKRFTREEMRRGIEVCKGCHETIHELFSEKDLARKYNSRDKLLEHPKVAKYVAWKWKARPRGRYNELNG